MRFCLQEYLCSAANVPVMESHLKRAPHCSVLCAPLAAQFNCTRRAACSLFSRVATATLLFSVHVLSPRKRLLFSWPPRPLCVCVCVCACCAPAGHSRPLHSLSTKTMQCVVCREESAPIRYVQCRTAQHSTECAFRAIFTRAYCAVYTGPLHVAEWPPLKRCTTKRAGSSWTPELKVLS